MNLGKVNKAIKPPCISTTSIASSFWIQSLGCIQSHLRTGNCLLHQKFHSAHFSTVGLVNKEGLPITKAYLFVPFSYFKPFLAAISVSVFSVCVFQYPTPLFCRWLFFPFHFTCRLRGVKCFSLLLLTSLALSV